MSQIKGGNCERCKDEGKEQKSQCRPSQSRKESILNCLLMGNRDFIYKSKRWIVSEELDQENNRPPRTNGSLFEKTLNL